MNRQLSEEFLYQYIPMAEQDMMDAIPAEAALEHAFSNRFYRKMKALVKYERRSSVGRFAAAFGRVAAAVLLVAVLLNTILVGSVKAYREKFFEIVQTVTEKFTSFFVEAEDAPANEFVPIEPPYIPEGFEMIEQFGDAVSYTVIYLSEEGQEIYYVQSLVVDGATHVDTEEALVELVQIEECTVYVVTKNGTTQLSWIDGNNEFLIISNTAYEDVLLMAEKIAKK